MGSRPTQEQMEVLVDFLELNPNIAKGLLRTHHAKQETKKKWSKIATTINALGGVTKDGPGWAKYWAEKKCFLKKTCAQHASAKHNGVEAPVLPNLSSLDLRLVTIIVGPAFPTENTKFLTDPSPKKTKIQPKLETQELVVPPAPQKDKVDAKLLNMDVPKTQLQNQAQIHADSRHSVPPIGTHCGARPQSRAQRNQSQVDEGVNPFALKDDRHVEAEVPSARALADASASLDRCAVAIREGAELISNALLEIARRMPPPAE